MWIPDKVADWLKISSDAVHDIREELAALRSERDALAVQNAINQTHLDWLRTKVNQLEMERAGLIEKAYDIKLPAVPELIRTPVAPVDPNQFSFDDIGDAVAKRLGFDIHAHQD